MKPLRLLALCLFAVAACTSEAPAPEATITTPTADMAESLSGEPTIENGVQIVNVTAGPMGYEPRSISLRAGMPARVVFTRTVDSACSSHVEIPAFGIPPTELPIGEPVAVDFTPGTSGSFTFVCGMDMQRGTVVVES